MKILRVEKQVEKWKGAGAEAAIGGAKVKRWNAGAATEGESSENRAHRAMKLFAPEYFCKTIHS